ncbi:MAG: hypothetical protein AB8G15_02715 [Saprospiraceae bacterium]
MKSYLLSLFFLLGITFGGAAQEAEKIVSIVQQYFPIEYYHTQAKLWKTKLTEKREKAVAWENYYAACRMANISTTGKDKPYDLDEIVKQAAQKVPNTFEYHRIAYWNHATDPSYYHHLEKAYQIDPNRSEIYDSMVSKYERNRNLVKKKFFNQKLYESGEYSPGAMTWNYNQLMSVEDHAILLTYGDFDTYPAWMLQEVKEVQTNVKVLNLNMLLWSAYRKKIFKELNIPPLKDFSGDVSRADFVAFTVALVPHLAAHNNRPVYLGVGCGPSIINRLEDELYLVGLAFQYSKEPFNNIAVLQEHLEHGFLLDHLKVSLYKDKSESQLVRLNNNYLPALVMLYKHYKSKGNPAAKSLKKLIKAVAKRGGMEEKVASIF